MLSKDAEYKGSIKISCISTSKQYNLEKYAIWHGIKNTKCLGKVTKAVQDFCEDYGNLLTNIGGSMGKESACVAGDTRDAGSILG